MKKTSIRAYLGGFILILGICGNAGTASASELVPQEGAVRNLSAGAAAQSPVAEDAPQNLYSGGGAQHLGAGDVTQNPAAGDADQKSGTESEPRNLSTVDAPQNPAARDAVPRSNTEEMQENLRAEDAPQNPDTRDDSQNPAAGDAAQNPDTGDVPQNPDTGDGPGGNAEQKPEDPVVEAVRMEVSVKSTDPDGLEITLAWEALQDASEYAVLYEDGDAWTELERTGSSRASVYLDQPGMSETYKICAYGADGVLRGESDELELFIPEKAGGLCTTALSKTKVLLGWEESDGASFYRIYVKKGENGYKLSETVEELEIRLAVKDKERCYFRVVPVFESGAGEIEGSPAQIEFVNQEIVLLDHQKYSYKEMGEDIQALCKKYSAYVSCESIGRSEQGREIYDVILGNPEAQNTILVVSTLHGREYIATAVCMKQLEYYLQNYNKTVDGKKLSKVFGDCNVHYVMMANPDGVTISQKSNARWKGNANGVNLNRNFPYKFRKEGSVKANSYSGKKAASESETKAVVALTKKLKKTQNLAVVNYHAMGRIVYGDYLGKNATLKNDVAQMDRIARTTTGYAVIRSGGSSNGNYREYLMYSLKIPSVTVEVGSVPCPVPQYQYASEFQRNKLLVLREAEWLTRR